MPNDTASFQHRADVEKQKAGEAGTFPSRRFSCVYLTSSIRVAEIASVLVTSVQIRIHRSTTLDHAEAQLRATKSRVLLTDISFERGGWEDALRMAARLPLRTAVVLVSRLADERLWIDALERGAYDLILEPFQADEMRRILENAHIHAISGESWQFSSPWSRRSKASAALA
jgi:DNA-binding NtrC family response regulator